MNISKYKYLNNFLIIFLIILLLTFNFQILSSGQFEYNTQNTFIITDEIILSNISIIKEGNYSIVQVENAITELKPFGKTVLPMISRTIIIPKESKLKDIIVTFSDSHVVHIEKNLQHKPLALPAYNAKQLNDTYPKEKAFIETSLSLDSIRYPDHSFNYSIGCGISNGKSVLFISLQFYPFSYQPELNQLTYSSSINYTIKYEITKENITMDNSIDMVIICPNRFVNHVQPLIEHKNMIGISTIIKTTEEIYEEFNGRDKPEQIKYFIKYALENWNISYVLLIGGHIGQSSDWYVPVRYSNLHDRSFWNDTYVTDLYFADIYRYNYTLQSIEFDDWDSNKNNVFAEWTWIYDKERGWWYDLDKKDNLDLYPDVFIGRLACRNVREVKNVVEKIIRYETSTYKKDWFHSIILVGGDTVPYSDGICEGEIETGHGASFLEPLGFSSKKLWVSNGKLIGPFGIKRALRDGAGFFYLSGHGTPREWCTHPQANYDSWIDLYSIQLRDINNFDKLPICIVGGCHNSQFDVSLSNIKSNFFKYGFSYFSWNEGIDCFFKWTWVPYCWSWNLVGQKMDGCIAAIGNTGLGWTVGGERCIEFNEGYLTTHFFKYYSILSQQGINNLGAIHIETLNDYISYFTANDDLLDRKTVEQWVLLGDPSLQIGGYPGTFLI